MKKILMMLGIATSMAVFAPVHAQSQGAQAQGKQGQQAQNDENPQMKGRRAVFGQVVGIRDIQLKGVQTKHRLVKIRNKQGNTVVVNVGDATRTSEGRLKKGTNVMAIGKAARINGKPVIFAKYIGDMRPSGFWGKAVVVPAKAQNQGQSQKSKQ